MLRFARSTLKVLNVANWIVGIAIIALFAVWAFVMPDRIAAIAVKTHPELVAANVIAALRLSLLAMPIMIAVIHKLLASLVAIIDTIPAGAVFSVENAARLRTVAWMMVAASALDDIWGIACTKLIGRYFMWSFTLTGWIAALMLFVLAMVWHQGAAMRADLEGTV